MNTPQDRTPVGRRERPSKSALSRESIVAATLRLLDQLDRERHGGPPTGVLVRVLQRILTLTAAIWHNDRTGQSVKRSLLAYDH